MAKETFKLTQVAAQQLIAEERLYLTSDCKRVVKEGSKEAAFLFAAKGQPVKLADAKKFGLIDEPAKGAETEARSDRSAKPTATR
jgi:hypothetical protein